MLRFSLLLVLLGVLSGCAQTGVKLSQGLDQPRANHCVVLLHGLARSLKSMQPLERAFHQAGYRTLNIGYPSTDHANQVLLEKHIAPQIQQHCSPELYRLSFVAHSMGGILSRYYIQQHKPPRVGGVVTIATPHQGSRLVNRLSWLPPFKWINGEAGYEMAESEAHADTLLNSLAEPDYPLLAIVGTVSFNPLYSLLIPGDDDGKVSVESASLGSAQEIVTVPYNHTFIMKKPRVIKVAVRFIDGL